MRFDTRMTQRTLTRVPDPMTEMNGGGVGERKATRERKMDPVFFLNRAHQTLCVMVNTFHLMFSFIQPSIRHTLAVRKS